MAIWYFRVTPEDSSKLPELVASISSALDCEPEEEDEDSARWETKQTAYEGAIEKILKDASFCGEVISDGESSGYGIEEWTFADGILTDVYKQEE